MSKQVVKSHKKVDDEFDRLDIENNDEDMYEDTGLIHKYNMKMI